MTYNTIVIAGVLEQVSSSFREGLDVSLLPWLLLITLLILISVYGVIWFLNVFVFETNQSQQKIGVLEALSQNLSLSSGQVQYLQALIERFKNNHPYEPEVSTKYLRTFLEYSVQNLSHGPTQTLRRLVHETPDLVVGHHMEVMVQEQGEWKTLSCEIDEQDGRFVILTKPPDVDELSLKEDDVVETSYRKGDLRLRGEAEVRQLTRRNLILFLPDGMHFEQQRSYQRIPTPSIEVKFRLSKGANQKTNTIQGIMEDLSAEGARVLVDSSDAVPEQTTGILELELPGFRTMDISAEVVRSVKYDDERTELGIHFTRVSLGNRERLHQYIHQNQPTGDQTVTRKKISQD